MESLKLIHTLKINIDTMPCSNRNLIIKYIRQINVGSIIL